MPKLPPLILLVEDERSIRDIISDVVDSAGFRIEVAGSYADGLVLLNASQPSLLIADALLPDGDGHKLAEIARHLGVPTLLVSGDPELILEAEESGVRFLAKPFRLADLLQMIQTLIEGVPLGDQAAAELRGRAAECRHMAQTETAEIAAALIRLAERFDRMAAELE